MQTEPEPTDEQIVLAANFESSDMDHLVVLMADLLDRLIAHNDQIPLVPAALTRFHSRTPPGITVLEYLRRIVRYTNVERSCLLITLHYIDHISARMPQFTISSLTVHRFVISSITISSKALCDAFCTNVHYAKVGGIQLGELNLLEKEFLAVIDWRLTCTREVLQAYYVKLARTHSSGRYKLPTPQPSASNSSGSGSTSSQTDSQSGSVSSSPLQTVESNTGSSSQPTTSPLAPPPAPAIPVSARSSPQTLSSATTSPPSDTSRSPTTSITTRTRIRSPLIIARRRSLLNTSPTSPHASVIPMSSPSPHLRAEKRSRNSPLVDLTVDLRPRGRRRIENE